MPKPGTEEFERLKEALRKEPTPEAMREAAERFREYEQTERARLRRRKPRRYRPYLVSLGYKKPYPSQIPLEKVPEELERNPELFKLLSKIITKGEK